MSDSGDDERRQWEALVDAARALVAWEEELGGLGFPDVEPPPRAARSAGDEGLERDAAPTPEPVAPAEDRATASAPSAAVGAGLAEEEAPTVAPASRAVRDVDEVVRRLEVLAEEARVCTACRLHEGRTRSVFARGSAQAIVAFVGEGPGYHEDQTGSPFVGPAGQLLDKMIAAMGLGPDELYVCNVVKCRPPQNRTPQPDEASACARFLVPQLELVSPKVIVALGRSASEGLGCIAPGARGWRGNWTTWKGIPVMSTFHPAYLLRSPEAKRPVWTDLQAVVAKLGRTLPARRS